MRKFVVASKNLGKLNEIKEILKDFRFDVISMGDVGISDDVEEIGSTFEENAVIKAEKISELTGEIVMADDSGLEVEYLNGAPGIFSSRFAGEGATDAERVEKLLSMLSGVPHEKRKARFVCAIAVVFPDGKKLTVTGECKGYINERPIGENGFGYDPIFYVPEYNITTAQMKPEEKHKISHRGNALRLMIAELEKEFGTKL
ncbi:MAG: XTP/dITP diphosphatase [Clostridia bacterium]|jgi:XTP/dITP diphosphohydrolase